jgi:hypothetical protein
MANNTKRVSLTEVHADTQAALFRQIWIMSNRKSFLSGLWLRDWLNTPQFPSLFAHILPKGQNQFPHFALYARNVVMLTPLEHRMLDHGTEEERISYSKEVKTADWTRISDLRGDLEDEYRKHFPSTYSGIINYKYSTEEVFNIVSKLNKDYWVVFERTRKSREP